MSLYLSRIGAPVTVDPAPNATKPDASRVFRTRVAWDGSAAPVIFVAAKGGAPVGTMWARMDGVEWCAVAGVVGFTVTADTVTPLPVCPADVDLFFQVTAANAATDILVLQSPTG